MENWKDIAIKQQNLAFQAKVLLFEVLASDATLDRHHDLRMNLINSSSQHLDGAIRQCFIAWDEAHRVNGDGLRLLEVYLPYIDSESYFSTYRCECAESSW